MHKHPAMYKIKDLTWNQIWSRKFCSDTVEQQIHDVIQVYQEQFQLILEDLIAIPKTTKFWLRVPLSCPLWLRLICFAPIKGYGCSPPRNSK